MIIYNESKSRFLSDVDSNILKQRLVDSFRAKTGSVPSDHYVWADEYSRFSIALGKARVDDDIQVAIEYYISAAGRFRIDVLLGGSDGQTDNGLIVELKAWEKADISDIQDLVWAPTGGGQHLEHPCIQAYKYQKQIYRFNEDVRAKQIGLYSAAYLFNLQRRNPEPLEDARYKAPLADAKLFLADDVPRLREYLEQIVPQRPTKDVVHIIENGRLRPSDELIARMSSMLDGNEEFELIDEQNIAFQLIRHEVAKKKNPGRHVFVVQGGPGTGKSVIAVRLLAEILREKRMGFFVAPNRAFRETLIEHLVRGNNGYRDDGIALFKSSWNFHDIDHKEDGRNDVLIVDEAHRLKTKANMYRGKNMVEDMVRASRITVFFVDETQRVAWNDIGSLESIAAAAAKFDSRLHKPVTLTAQYRCNGSSGYLNWLDDVLQIRKTANFDNWGDGQYEFKVFEKADDLYRALLARNADNRARLIAGYSWEWPKEGRKRGTTIKHVQADDLALPWNFDGENWATSRDGIAQVGCVHTSQGVEFDWLGVLIGEDLGFDGQAVVGRPEKRARNDSSLKGWKTEAAKAAAGSARYAAVLAKVQAIIKNTYKVLLSRGRKGCFVWCADPALRNYLQQRLALASRTATSTQLPEIVNDPGKQKYVSYAPIYELKAAAGLFGAVTDAENLGWLKIPNDIRLTKQHFVSRVVGKSMEPLIPSGSTCLFRFGVIGSRVGRIVLAQHNEISDPETGGSFTVKKYFSTKTAGTDDWSHETIRLVPLNPDFKPVEITPQNADEMLVIAEFVRVL